MNRIHFFYCKHKHMMKCGAPPVPVPYVYLYNYMVSQAELILRVITLWFLVLPQFCIEGMGPFKTLVDHKVKFFDHGNLT